MHGFTCWTGMYELGSRSNTSFTADSSRWADLVSAHSMSVQDPGPYRQLPIHGRPYRRRPSDGDRAFEVRARRRYSHGRRPSDSNRAFEVRARRRYSHGSTHPQRSGAVAKVKWWLRRRFGRCGLSAGRGSRGRQAMVCSVTRIRAPTSARRQPCRERIIHVCSCRIEV